MCDLQQHRRLPGRLLLALQPRQAHVAALLREPNVRVALGTSSGAAAGVARALGHLHGDVCNQAALLRLHLRALQIQRTQLRRDKIRGRLENALARLQPSRAVGTAPADRDQI